MEIPVYENENLVGTLLVSAQGLYTVFEVRLPPARAGTAIGRTSPEAASESAAEQCSAPWQKRADTGAPLTRLWLGGGTEGFASLGLLEPGRGERRLRRKLSRLEMEKLPPAPWLALVLPAGESPQEEGLPRARGRGRTPSRERRLRDEDPSAAHSEFAWTPCPDGSLVDPTRRLLALPCALRQEGAGLRIICIDGKDYLVFHY